MSRGNKQIEGQLTFEMCLNTENFVCQSNALVGGKQALKLNSAKLVRAAIMQIKPDDKEIKKNDWMGMGDSGLLSVNADITVAFKEMIDEMVSDDSAVVSIYWGEGSDQAKAEALGADIQEKYPDLEVEISEGGQAVYAYIVSVE